MTLTFALKFRWVDMSHTVALGLVVGVVLACVAGQPLWEHIRLELGTNKGFVGSLQ